WTTRTKNAGCSHPRAGSPGSARTARRSGRTRRTSSSTRRARRRPWCVKGPTRRAPNRASRT
ncbi:MAG: hypothetical protein AVDCRST_MAG25-2991, partial [uncultured Rubrobacteraceae bacterium]